MSGNYLIYLWLTEIIMFIVWISTKKIISFLFIDIFFINPQLIKNYLFNRLYTDYSDICYCFMIIFYYHCVYGNFKWFILIDYKNCEYVKVNGLDCIRWNWQQQFPCEVRQRKDCRYSSLELSAKTIIRIWRPFLLKEDQNYFLPKPFFVRKVSSLLCQTSFLVQNQIKNPCQLLQSSLSDSSQLPFNYFNISITSCWNFNFLDFLESFYSLTLESIEFS